MPRPRTLPDADVLQKLRVGEGLTYQEIADRYGVSKAAVHLALRKSGLVTPRPRYDEEIPWTVAMEHSSDYLLSQLRYAARVRRGEKLPEAKARYLQNWINELAKPRPNEDPSLDAPLGLVVAYDRETGFSLVPRRPHDDWLICSPVGADEGVTA